MNTPSHDSPSRDSQSHDAPSRDSQSHDAPSRDSQSHDAPSRDSRNANLDVPTSHRSSAELRLDSESRATIIWHTFDPDVEVLIGTRTRPHWDQTGAVTFVTIRLADSVPKAVIQRWLAEQQAWLSRRGLKDLEVDSMLARTDLPRDLQRAFTKFRNQRWNEHLDSCHGSCLLRNTEYARIVADALLHFDGVRYDVDRFVIMPNHVHVLVQMRPGWELRKQCESWMRYSGRQIHAAAKTSGPCWAEPFDHVVRNADQFQYLRQYIVDNPRKARLRPGEYLLWIRGPGFFREVVEAKP